jgi:PAS domain S-box-containing protein
LLKKFLLFVQKIFNKVFVKSGARSEGRTWAKDEKRPNRQPKSQIRKSSQPPLFTQALQIPKTMEVLSALSYRHGDLNAYLNLTVKNVSELIGLDWSVLTLCQNGLERILASSIDIGAEIDKVTELHGTVTGKVVETGKCVVVEDTTLNPESGRVIEGYRSYLGVPLRLSTGEVIGTICSFHRQPRKFSSEEIMLVEVFAERAATVIDNYNLYQEQQRLTQMLQAEIEERKEIEQALQKREEQLRQIAENLEPVVWIYSTDGMPLYISPAFEQLSGLSCELWYSDRSAWRSIIHSDDRAAVYAAFETSKYDIEYRISRPDGSQRILHERSFPIVDAKGEIYRIAGIAEDITQRKQEQQTTIQALQRLSELGELAVTIVHEVRNPLTTLLMGLNYFQRVEISDAARKRLNLSLEEGDRLKRLLNEILLFAKREILNTETVELNAELARQLESISQSPTIGDRQLNIQLELTPIYVLLDRDKFRQVLINLVQNACEAVSKGDEVVIKLSSNRAKKEATLQICNGGDRIPTEAVTRLLEPFYTTKPSGNGLGLSIVRKIVEAHGGNFNLNPIDTGGAVAEVHLPIQEL